MTVEKVIGAKYVVATDAYEGYIAGKHVKQGDVVTLTEDDGTAAPLFRVPNGETVFLSMKDLVKLNIDGEAPVKKAVKTITQEEFDSIRAGDKVTVRSDLSTDLQVRNGVTSSMAELAGETVTVKGTDGVDIKVEGLPCYWCKEMLTAVIKKQKPKFAVGDIVTTDGVLGTADWDIARKITAVNTETQQYEMEWADGIAVVALDTVSFEPAEELLTYYTGDVPVEPKFDCPELVAGEVYYMEEVFNLVFRYYPCASNTADTTYVGGAHTAISATGTLYTDPTGLRINNKYRKATAEEVLKLENTEKEAGYVPPLVNELGTVIEVGGYYEVKGLGGTRVLQVSAVENDMFHKEYLVSLDGANKVSYKATDIGSAYGSSAVPATEQQIALYDAAVALEKAKQVF